MANTHLIKFNIKMAHQLNTAEPQAIFLEFEWIRHDFIKHRKYLKVFFVLSDSIPQPINRLLKINIKMAHFCSLRDPQINYYESSLSHVAW